MTREYELAVQRRVTMAFIEANPISVTLTPKVRGQGADRSWIASGAARAAQVGRLIPITGSGIVVRDSRAGTVSAVGCQLLLPSGAVIAKNDTFSTSGEEYRVVEIEPDNGYETRAQVARYASLGSEVLTVRRAVLVTVDRYGKQTRDWSTAIDHTVSGASVQPVDSAEAVVDREYVATHLVAYAPLGADILATDRVVWRDISYEVDGPPQAWIDIADTPDHTKVLLKRMAG